MTRSNLQATAAPSPASPPSGKLWLEVVGSQYILNWLADRQKSPIQSACPTGKRFFLGRKAGHQLSALKPTFLYCMRCWRAFRRGILAITTLTEFPLSGNFERAVRAAVRNRSG
jgi:hypothetical protein